jgi:hypothetical protein
MRLAARWHLLIFVGLLGAELAMFPPAYRALPPQVGDAVEVHNIAFQLARGHGYRFDWDDPDWRRLYADHNDGGRYTPFLARHGAHATLARPPLLPLIVAGLARLVAPADVFFAWRVGDAVLFAAAGCLLCDTGVALAAGVGLTLTVALLLLHPLRWTFIPGTWTEGPAFDLVAVLAWMVATPGRGRGVGRAWVWRTLGGVTLGLLCLDRSIFVPVLPVLCLIVAGAEPMPAGAASRRQRWGRRAGATAVVLSVAMAVQLPWWARNVAVSHRFLPLGTQGGFNLPDEYGDAALTTGGQWTGQGISDVWVPHHGDTVPAPPGYPPADFANFRCWPWYAATLVAFVCSTTASEVAVSDAGTRAAVAWIRTHPTAIPGLWGARVWHLAMGDPALSAAVLVALPIVWIRRRDLRRTLVGLTGLAGAYVLAVALTHVVFARFLVPILPPMYLLVATGVAALLGRGGPTTVTK